MKKAMGVFICLCITSYFSTAYAHGTFTWFGFKNDNAQVMINSGTPHHGPACAPMIADTKNQNRQSTSTTKNRQNTTNIIDASGGGVIKI